MVNKKDDKKEIKHRRRRAVVVPAPTEKTPSAITPDNSSAPDGGKPPVDAAPNPPAAPLTNSATTPAAPNTVVPVKVKRDFWGRKRVAATSAQPNPKKTFTEKRGITLKAAMLVISALASLPGFFMLYQYVVSMNMAMGIGGSLIVGISGVLFFYYLGKEETITVTRLATAKVVKGPVNALNIYPDRVEFDSMADDKLLGFPQLCLNLKKRIYVHIWDDKAKSLKAFVLPDQVYYDPIVFAQRVLGLPAHKRLFERKPTLVQKLKTAMLVLAIGIVWLLIMTTTGGA